MTDRQRKFIDEYRISGNATRAAIRAGYSEHTARSQGQRLLTKADVVERLRELGEQDHDVKVANAREVLEYLTSVLRGESRSEVIVVEGAGTVSAKRDRCRRHRMRRTGSRPQSCWRSGMGF